jgi:hypothetical protein
MCGSAALAVVAAALHHLLKLPFQSPQQMMKMVILLRAGVC